MENYIRSILIYEEIIESELNGNQSIKIKLLLNGQHDER